MAERSVAELEIIDGCAELAKAEKILRKGICCPKCAAAIDQHLLNARAFGATVANRGQLDKWHTAGGLLAMTANNAVNALVVGDATPRQVADMLRPARRECMRRTRGIAVRRAVEAVRGLATKRNLSIALAAAGGWYLLKR